MIGHVPKLTIACLVCGAKKGKPRVLTAAARQEPHHNGCCAATGAEAFTNHGFRLAQVTTWRILASKFVGCRVMETKYLRSWKEIAEYLKTSIRTAQRYEALGLPIHRIRGMRMGGVFALKPELDQWLLKGGLDVLPQPANEANLKGKIFPRP